MDLGSHGTVAVATRGGAGIRLAIGQAAPLGRIGGPQDYAGAAAFLASSDSHYVVAQTLNLGGGN